MTSTEERLGELERRCAQAEAVQAALEARCTQTAQALAVQAAQTAEMTQLLTTLQVMSGQLSAVLSRQTQQCITGTGL